MVLPNEEEFHRYENMIPEILDKTKANEKRKDSRHSVTTKFGQSRVSGVQTITPSSEGWQFEKKEL